MCVCVCVYINIYKSTQNIRHDMALELRVCVCLEHLSSRAPTRDTRLTRARESRIEMRESIWSAICDLRLTRDPDCGHRAHSGQCDP